MSQRQLVTVIAGAGPGNGAALARRFSAAGDRVVVMARSQKTLDLLHEEVEGLDGHICDLTRAEAIADSFAAIRRDVGEVDRLIYNAGSGLFEEFKDTSAAQFEDAWRVNTLGAYLCVQEVIPAMQAANSGTILFMGATASRRGGKKTVAFAAAKAAQRSLAESLARTFGADGIHVALMIVDGMIDTPSIRERIQEASQDFFIQPSAIAETAFQLSTQDRSAWTFELDIRPFAENW